MTEQSMVKAIRLDNATVQRITVHVARLQAQWGLAVRVTEGMAIRDVILKGLEVVEVSAGQEPTPRAPEAPTGPAAEDPVHVEYDTTQH